MYLKNSAGMFTSVVLVTFMTLIYAEFAKSIEISPSVLTAIPAYYQSNVRSTGRMHRIPYIIYQ